MALILGRRPGAPRDPATFLRAGARRSGSTLPAVVASLCAGLIGVAIVVASLATPSGLYGVTQYDDGVYLASAYALVHGSLPYKDFVFVQPPGITLLLAPLALVVHDTRSALGIARVLTAVVTGVNAAAVGLLLRRHGLLASATGAFALALFPPAYAADHSVLLEPYVVLFCLIGTWCVFDAGRPRRARLLLGGLAFAVACALKLTGALPLLACLAVLLPRRRRDAGLVALGAAIGLLALVGPFFFAAPGALVHQILSTQLLRSAANTTPVAERLAALSGVAYLTKGIGLGDHALASYLVPAILGALILLGTLAFLRRISDLDRFALAGSVVVAGALFVPAQFFDHYAYFSAGFLALALGGAIGRLATRTSAALAARGASWRALAGALGAIALVVGGVALAKTEIGYDRFRAGGAEDPGPVLMRELAPGTCSASDASILLISANRFVAPSSSCPSILDATGTWLSIDPAHPALEAGPRDPRLVARWSQVFHSVSAVVLANPTTFRIPWTPALRAQFDRAFVLTSSHGPPVYLRRTSPRT